jgi:hypothetical protein
MQDELALRWRRDEGRPGRGGVAAVVCGEDDERGWEQRASEEVDADAGQTDVHRREEIRYTHPSRCLPEEDWSSRRRARDLAV